MINYEFMDLIIDKIQRLLDYKMVVLDTQDVMLIRQLNFGYALKKTQENFSHDSNDIYYLEYQQHLYKTEEDFIQDVAFICSLSEDSTKEFLEYMFEVKGYQFKTLYKKGLKNFKDTVFSQKWGYDI